MARIRSIKPEFFIDEDLQDLEAENPGAHCMLVFAGLWGNCSKEGVFEYKPRVLKLSILPFLDFSLADTLSLLEKAGFIRRFCADEKEYGYIPSFEKHQRISGKEAQYSPKYPSPTEGNNGEISGKQRGSAEEAQEKEREKEKEKEKERNQQQSPPISPPPGDDGETATEGLFRRCFEANEAKILRLFPGVDLAREREVCVAHYRKRAPPADPLPLILKWFQRIRKGGEDDGAVPRKNRSGGRTAGIVPANGPDADWLGGSQFDPEAAGKA